MLDPAVISTGYQAGVSLRVLAQQFGVSRYRIEMSLAESGTPLRAGTAHLTDRADPWRDADLMRRLYLADGLSTLDIAEKFRCDRSVITDWLSRHGIPTRTTKETQKGKKPGNFGRGKRNSAEMVECGCGCGGELKRFNHGSSERRFLPSHHTRGSLNVNWKGGNTPISNASRRTPAHLEWRNAVRERDAFTCQTCGAKPGKVHAHHLDNYADHPEKRFDPDNGVLLCIPCHRRFHAIYGHQNKTTAAQFRVYKEQEQWRS